MKKFFRCAVMFLCMSAVCAFADSEPPSFIIFNAVKFSGGNDAVHIREFDYTQRPQDPSEEQDRANPYNYYVTVLSQKWSDKPADKNKKPTSRNGLLNQHDPIDITAYGDHVTMIYWGGDMVETFRILDSNGRELFAESTKTGKRREFDLKAGSTLPVTYYAELGYSYTTETRAPSIGFRGLSIPLGGTKTTENVRCCYVQLRVSAGRERRVVDVFGGPVNDRVTALLKGVVMSSYMAQKYHLADRDDVADKLTEKQMTDAAMEYQKKYPSWENVAASVAESYLKEHNVKNFRELSDDAFDEMHKEYERRITSGTRAPTRKAPAKKTRKTK